jgi:hypothetical protein
MLYCLARVHRLDPQRLSVASTVRLTEGRPRLNALTDPRDELLKAREVARTDRGLRDEIAAGCRAALPESNKAPLFPKGGIFDV